MKPIKNANSYISPDPNSAQDKQQTENKTPRSPWIVAINKRNEIPKTPSTRSRPQLGKAARSSQGLLSSTSDIIPDELENVSAIGKEEDQESVPRTASRPLEEPATSYSSSENAFSEYVFSNLPLLPSTPEPSKNPLKPEDKPAEEKALHHQNAKFDTDAIQNNKNLKESQKTTYESKAQQIKSALLLENKTGIADPRRAVNILYAAAGGQDVINDPDPGIAKDIEFLKKLPAEQRSMYVEALRDSLKQFNPLFQSRMPKYQDGPEVLQKWLDGSLGPRE